MVFFVQLAMRSKHGLSYKGCNDIEWSQGKQKLLWVTGRFELSSVSVTKGKCIEEIHMKSTLVCVRARFELSRV